VNQKNKLWEISRREVVQTEKVRYVMIDSICQILLIRTVRLEKIVNKVHLTKRQLQSHLQRKKLCLLRC
jgi:hypothetical protein